MDKQKLINEKLAAFFKDTEFSGYSYEDHDSADDVIEAVREQINEEEVIYYANAMDYLHEHDCSLQESMAIAAEFGYTPDNINSELLATLLIQRNLEEELGKLTDEIEEIFDQVDEEIEAQEEKEEEEND